MSLLLAVLAVGCVPAFAGRDVSIGLAEALKKHYRLATIKLNINGDSGLQPGTVLSVRKEGILSFAEKDSSYATLCPTEIQAGVVRTSNTAACTSLAPKSRRYLKTDETVCVTAIDVSTSSDTVSFFLATCNPNEPASKAGRDRALAVFHLPAGSLVKTSAITMERVISETLSEADSASTEMTDSGKSVNEGPVYIGQSADQVWESLGPPTVVADLGDRLIYFYPTHKIFFTNRKVSNITQR